VQNEAPLEEKTAPGKQATEAVAGHGASSEESASELTELAEWDSMLDDLDEMGFNDRSRNKNVLVANNGSINQTVKALLDPKHTAGNSA